MLDLSLIVRLPHLEQGDARKMLEAWSNATENPLDKFAPEEDYSAIAKLKQEFNK